MAPPQGKKPKKKTVPKDTDEPIVRKDTAEYVTSGEFGRYFEGMPLPV